MSTLEHSKKVIFDHGRWRQELGKNKTTYNGGDPYPHIQLENFLEDWAVERALAEFPKVKEKGWIHYLHFNEKKHGLNKIELLPPFIREVIDELNSAEFVSWLSELTGIPDLKSDDMLEGGGIHQSERGGFLNVHADFTVHPHKTTWKRRVNVLVYLNKDWQSSYNGDLELWSKDMKSCVKKISPVFNRCVIFNTDEDSYHGLPDTLLCPEGETRKSIALYYFTEEANPPRLRATNYQARPQDGPWAVIIFLDKKMISLYTLIKTKLSINDDFISKVLSFFSKKKNRN